jgi:DNA primase
VDAVEEIKSRIGIDDVVGRYVDLKRSGASLKGLCPFHQEKTPSFYVTPARGTYHCFGCGKGGDIFQFLIEVEHLTFPEALQRLADQAGVRLEERDDKKPSLKKQLYAANDAALAFFRECLAGNRGARARTYLEERRFDQQAIELFDLGYAPDERDALVQHLRRQGFEERIILSAGLAFQSDEGDALRSRFRGRLMFPIRDQSGKVSGFGGRTLGDAQPKYLNSPQTEIFDKSSVLYGVHRAADAIRKAGRSVLVEGYLDAVRAHRAGFAWTVASLGTAVTVPQLTALSRLADTVVIALDPDPAGQSAAARAAITARNEVARSRVRAAGGSGAVDLRVARLPAGLGDPDEFIRDHPEQWEPTIDHSIPVFEFFFRQKIESYDRSAETWRQQALDELVPAILSLNSTVERAQRLAELAHEVGIDPKVLELGLPRARPERRDRRTSALRAEESQERVRATTTRQLVKDPVIAAERALLSLLLSVVVVPSDAVQLLRDLTIDELQHRQILEAILQWAESGGYDYEFLRETIPQGLRDRADELRASYQAPTDLVPPSVNIAYHLARLRAVRLRSEVEQLHEAMAHMDPDEMVSATQLLGRLYDEREKVDVSLDQLSKSLLRAAGGGPDQGTMLQDSGRL